MPKTHIAGTFQRFLALALALILMLQLIPAQALAEASDALEDNQEEPASQVGADVAEEDAEPSAQLISVSDPRVTPDSSMTSGQVTTWDCVWLGYYPQTYVDDADTVAALDVAAGWNENGDLTYDGVTYRRLQKSDANCINENPESWSWSDRVSPYEYCYFRWEPVKWRVLEVDGTQALVLADIGLDEHVYTPDNNSVSWETCALRSWLATTFWQTCFTDAQQGAVIEKTIENASNIKYGRSGGANTTDRVFVLAESDVWSDRGSAARHGFAAASDIKDEARRCLTSDYAHAMGTWNSTSPDTLGNNSWWLRSPGYWSFSAVRVTEDCNVATFGQDGYSHQNNVRPAMYVDITSDQVIYAGTVSSNGGVDEQVAPGVDPSIAPQAASISNPRVVSDDSTTAGKVTTWECVWLGSYPQTYVNDATTIAALDAATGWDENENLTYEGRDYHRLQKRDATYSQDGNADYWDWGKASSLGYCYFVWEPIKWRVLETDGSTALIVSDMALDDRRYNDTFEMVDWEHCTIRSWLINDFWPKALTYAQRNKVVAQTLPYIRNNLSYVGNETKDRVFLLSNSDAADRFHGFTDNAMRQCQSSDYARAMGSRTSTSESYLGNSGWWIRSSYDKYSTFVTDAGVLENGNYVYKSENGVDCATHSVRPAMRILISSDQVSYAGTVSSDGTVDEQAAPYAGIAPEYPTVGGPYENSEQDNKLIDAVGRYTTGDMTEQYQGILNDASLTHEAKAQKLFEFFLGYGYLDPREGIRYLQESSRERWDYSALLEDDMYLASQFVYDLDNGPQGAALRASLATSGFIFNDEFSALFDPLKARTGETPMITKYKAMLYDFMSETVTEQQLLGFAKWFTDITRKSIDLGETDAKIQLDKINSLLGDANVSKDELDALIDELPYEDIFAKYDDDNMLVLDEEHGFGKFAKRQGKLFEAFGLAFDSAESYMEYMEFDVNLEVYETYIDFLHEIQVSSDLPNSLRGAAVLVEDEINAGQLGKVASLASEIIYKAVDLGEFGWGKITGDGFETACKTVLGVKAGRWLTSELSAIKMTAWFIDQLTGVGGLAKGAHYVEGYNILATHWKNRLLEDEKVFLASRTPENAWQFYYDYKMLQSLRYSGEKAVSDMYDIGGFTALFAECNIKEFKEAALKSMSALNERTFQLEVLDTVPAPFRYATKAVIACPVDVRVIAPSGDVVAELPDGDEMVLESEHGWFAVTKRLWSGDYAKTIALHDGEGYSIEVTGIDLGLVEIQVATSEDSGEQVALIDTIAVEPGTVIRFPANAMTEDTYTVDTDGDGEYDASGTFSSVATEEEELAAELALSTTELRLEVGESELITPIAQPAGTKLQSTYWVSQDEGVAKVTDGKVTGVEPGHTTVTCVSQHGNRPYAVCDVYVLTSLADASVDAIDNQAYTGDALTPKPKVTIDDKTLVEGTDYTLSYADNVDKGTATVTIEGKGDYTGRITATFSIVTAWERLAGDGRYDTMAEIISEGWSGQTGGTVVVATGEGFKDALAAAGLACLDGGPVVLTAGKSLSKQAELQLKALRPSKVYVAGGEAAVSKDVLTAIQRVTGVKPTRVFGQTSASTSAALAKAGGDRWDGTAIIATNKSFKDALSVAPVSYAKRWPILLADNGKSLNADVIAALRACGIRRAYIVGGKLAVTENVESQLKKAGVELADRLSGANGVETSRMIADFALENGLTVANMAFATSQNFPDALAGAALCGKNGSVLLLCDDKAPANLNFATSNSAGIKTGYVFGGELAFSEGLFDSLPK